MNNHIPKFDEFVNESQYMTTLEESMSDIDILAQEAKNFKDFVKQFKTEYADIASAGTEKELETFLKAVYDNSSKNNESKETPIEVTKGQEAYYKGLPKSTAQKKKSQITAQAEKPSDDPSAYKALPGDKKAQSQGKVKTSSYVKKYREMFGESVNEKETTEDQLKKGAIENPDIEKALKKKVEETGVDIDILRVVMRRGMAAWKAGHRPGATQEQWGYARIASFVTKGPTYKSTDSDMAKVARDRGQL